MAKNLRAIVTVQKVQVTSNHVKSEAVTSYQKAEAIATRNDFSTNQFFLEDNFSNSWNGHCSLLAANGNTILTEDACNIVEGVWTPSQLPNIDGVPYGGTGTGSSYSTYEVNPGLSLCSVFDASGNPIADQIECFTQGGEWHGGFCSVLDANNGLITDEITCNATSGRWYPDTISVPLDDILFWAYSKNVTETLPLVELYSSAYNKPTTETLSLLETFAKVITWTKSFTDAFTLDDAAQIDKDYYGVKGNVAFMLDVLGINLNRPVTDSYTVGDIYTAAVNKIVSENLSLIESQIKSSNLGKTDSFSIPETINLSPSLVKSDSYSFSDTYYATLSKIVTDSITLSEVVSLGSTYPITESYSISDSIISEINKVIADAFTLDDSALIDKDYYGNKGNICTVSDVIALAITWVRGYSDSISTSDSANIANISGKVFNGTSFNRLTLN